MITRWRDRPAAVLFLATAALSFGVLVAMGTQLTFFLDDWEFLTFRYDPSWHAVMSPHNEHASIAPVLVYEALLHSFGMDSSTPFRVVATIAFLAGVALLFVWIRRRVGDWLALAGTVPLLFFGTGAEDLLFPFQLGYFGSIACGVAALLALERDDRIGDRLACLLLVAGLTFSSIGIPFVVAGAVWVGWDARRWRRAFVVVVPALLYALWWLGWGHEAESHLSTRSIATIPSYVLDGLASSLSSLLGVAGARKDVALGPLDWGRPLLALAAAVVLWRIVRGPRPTRTLWVILSLTLAYWALAGSSAYFEARAPTAGRYQYVGAFFIIMLVAELLRGVRVTRAAMALIWVGVGVSLAGNLAALVDTYRAARETSQTITADLGALELARGIVRPQFQIDADNGGTDWVGVQPAFYFPAVDAVGSTADSEAELRAAPEAARRNADTVSAAALRLRSRAVGRAPAAGGPAPVAVGAERASTGAGPCVDSSGRAAGPEVFVLPPAGVAVTAGKAPVTLSLRRYASSGFPITAGEAGPGQTAVLRIPQDAGTQAWQLGVESRAPARLCGLSSGGG